MFMMISPTQIVAKGSLTSFEPKSQYQLKITKIAQVGEGNISWETKRLREKLDWEGLFNNDRKQKIPSQPKKMGIIASKNSEAIQDIFHVINSRNQMVETVTAHATMQGEGAPSSIIKALKDLNDDPDIDVIILARGGGTSEDLMAFNDEGLVRAIASSKKPVITGIGHAEDTSLADLAADVKATTPSTAAEAAVPKGHKSDIQKYRVVIAVL
jgi:exodeoxyribonuclease VII large subunit